MSLFFVSGYQTCAISNCSSVLNLTGGIHETPFINPQWSGALRVENTLAQWNNACYFRAAGFYVQDVRYAAGAGSAGEAISRLVALVPKPRVNLTRFHGVFAPYADIGIRCIMPTSGLFVRIDFIAFYRPARVVCGPCSNGLKSLCESLFRYCAPNVRWQLRI